MGRSLHALPGGDRVEDFTRAEVTHAPTGLVYRAWVDADGRSWQEERLPGTDYVRRVEAKYAIGSGNHTRSYLGVVDGGLVQLPLTWYARKRLWDLSPGYAGPDQPRFSRPVEPACLFCHADLTPVVPGTDNAYAGPLAGISCARCHGDGTAHVAARQAGRGPPAGRPDPSIYNPGRDTPERQLQVCQQCHLQGDTRVLHAGRRWDRYDPRQPLDRFLSAYFRAGNDGDAFAIASHGQRLALSRCAQASGAKLRCTTCHDPHRPASEGSYRAACLSCHEAKQCGDAHGHAADADCAGCHMRRGGTSDIPHVEFTDHFIRRRPADERRAEPTTKLVDLVAGAEPPSTPAAAVREALAHALLWERFGHPEHLPLALRALESALRQDPARGDAWAALARARAASGDPAGAEAAFAEAVKRGDDDALLPDDRARALVALGRADDAAAVLRAARPTRARWLALAMLEEQRGRLDEAGKALDAAEAQGGDDASVAAERGALAQRLGRPAEALEWLRRALARDPLHRPAALRLASLEIEQGRAADARRLLDGVLKRDARVAPAWFLRGHAALALGDAAAAVADLERALSLDPGKPVIRAELARAYEQAGRPDAARTVGAPAPRR